jgi:hypothetical protein
MLQITKLDLFAGIPVAEYAAALNWYERLPVERAWLRKKPKCGAYSGLPVSFSRVWQR